MHDADYASLMNAEMRKQELLRSKLAPVYDFENMRHREPPRPSHRVPKAAEREL